MGSEWTMRRWTGLPRPYIRIPGNRPSRRWDRSGGRGILGAEAHVLWGALVGSVAAPCGTYRDTFTIVEPTHAIARIERANLREGLLIFRGMRGGDGSSASGRHLHARIRATGVDVMDRSLLSERGLPGTFRAFRFLAFARRGTVVYRRPKAIARKKSRVEVGDGRGSV